MKSAALMIPLLAACTAMAWAAPEGELQRAEKEWAGAVVGQKMAVLDQILAKDLIYAHSTGNVESKEEYLGRLRSGKQKYDKIDHESIRAQVYGDAGVTHSLVRMAGVSNGKPFNDHIMMLHLWVRQGGAWRLVGHQTTKIP